MGLPRAWLTRHRDERDILWTLHTYGPKSNSDLRYHIGHGQIDGRQGYSNYYRYRDKLLDEALIEGDSDEYQLTREGQALVEGVLAELTGDHD